MVYKEEEEDEEEEKELDHISIGLL